MDTWWPDGREAEGEGEGYLRFPQTEKPAMVGGEVEVGS